MSPIKHIGLAFILAILPMSIAPSLYAGTPPIIATFDMERAVATSKVGKDIIEQYQVEIKKLESEAQTRAEGLRSEAQRLQEQRSLIAPDALQTRAEELRVKENAIKRELTSKYRALEAGRQKAVREIAQLAAEQLEQVAKKRKADLVIRREVLFHARTDWDVTAEVVTLMNKKETKKKLEAITQPQQQN